MKRLYETATKCDVYDDKRGCPRIMEKAGSYVAYKSWRCIPDNKRDEQRWSKPLAIMATVGRMIRYRMHGNVETNEHEL